MPVQNRRPVLVLLALSLLAAASCGDDPFAVDPQVIEEVEFAASLNIDLSAMTKLASGVYILDVEAGTGDPLEGGTNVTVGFTGRLTDGSVFDAGSFPFLLGGGQVIPGFDAGVMGMRVGGQRRIIIPPEQGYGAAGRPGIPGGAILIFDVEVLSVG